MKASRLDLERQREEPSAEELAEQLRHRYSRMDYGRTAQYVGDEGDVPQHTLIPSVQDPSLWVVKCKPGKERDVVNTIMRKYLDRENTDNPLDVSCCFMRDTLKGYIYIESRSNASVVAAITNVNNVYHSKVMLVPIKDMVDTMQAAKKEVQLQPGGWVRMRRGKYTGDLCQLIEVFDSGDLVRRASVETFRFVSGGVDTSRARISALQQRQEQDRKWKARKPLSQRPPQKLFNPKEIELLDRTKPVIPKGRNVFTYGTDVFKDGFLEKDVRVGMLTVENVNPTLEEIQRFAGDGGANGYEGNVDLSALAATALKDGPVEFVPGDKVEVTNGEMKNVQGIVQSVDGSQITVAPNASAGLERSLTFPAKQLRKCFEPGAHVRVANGRFANETGLVLRVDDNVITLLSDLNLKEVNSLSDRCHGNL
ncbi:MAG: early transcription elongation factor of RNA pol II, NGN section-domain-containing protein [Olpidium bornovanus]|uniref:Transcription elongation factor SPT5 n=1 Tax=Olpidium bornovanus TaxID=278681 RepID=A0A8H8DEY0_9FUNG|nr:MAG: early transcription elongation factor of RNA pol II, NGN section-domain-containing protein [Olpidium bornovanus]